MTALYNLTDQYLALENKLAQDGFDPQTIADTIESSEIFDAIQNKAQAIEQIARNAEMHTSAIDAEIERLQDLKEHRIKIATGLRNYLLTNMQRLNISKIESPLVSFSIKDNPPSVEIEDQLQIPAEYMKQPEPPTPKPNKQKIAADIKAGKQIPGARLVQTQRLVIK